MESIHSLRHSWAASLSLKRLLASPASPFPLQTQLTPPSLRFSPPLRPLSVVSASAFPCLGTSIPGTPFGDIAPSIQQSASLPHCHRWSCIGDTLVGTAGSCHPSHSSPCNTLLLFPLPFLSRCASSFLVLLPNNLTLLPLATPLSRFFSDEK